jgi:N-acyl-D-aspartate/D-glutamate deacylase
VLFSWGLSSEKGSGRASAGVLEQICEGRDMTAITQVRGTGYMFGLQAGLPFRGEAWDQLRAMPFDARVKAIKDPAFATRLAEGEWAIGQSLNNVYYLGAEGSPNHTAEREDNVVKACKASGERFEAMFVRLSQETDGRALFNLRMFCQDLHELGDLFRSPHILPSLGDAGAHVSQIMDADWSTFILSYWVRQRKHFTMGEAIRKMTSDPARVLRLRDRGVLAVGKKADVAVFNPDTVQSLQPHIVRDFPGNAPRYIQRARGYKATVVNGRVNVLDDNLLGSRAGRVLRHAA